MTRPFAKEMPGATCVFQPDHIANYKDDPWDIRISLGNAPIDEAYYFTVEDPEAIYWPVTRLLDQYALNPELESQLDIDTYPELPFLQRELIQYFGNHKQGLLKVNFFINHSPCSEPIDIAEPAEKHLCVCTSHDHSWDFRVLDLIMVPEVPALTEREIESLRSAYGEIFLLMLLDYHSEERLGRLQAPVAWPSAAGPGGSDRPCLHGLQAQVDRMEADGLIRRKISGTDSGIETGEEILTTEKGKTAIAELNRENAELADLYDCFDSVAVSPAALGVPDGFDVRVQMMEFDGRDYDRSVLIRVLHDDRDRFFSADTWLETYVYFTFYDHVRDALAYKTNFSEEVLQALRGLAGQDNEASDHQG